MPTLLEQLEGAKIIAVDGARGLVLAWFGGGGVNAYNITGKEVSYWTIRCDRAPTKEEVLASMELRIRDGDY